MAILVRRGKFHNSVPVPGLTQLEATAVQVTLLGRPVKILAAYLSRSRPLIGADLTACFGGGLPVLNSRPTQRQTSGLELPADHETGKFLRDYAYGNSSLIFEPDTPATKPYNRSTTPDALDIAVTKELPFPVYLTLCSKLCSDHLPVHIDTVCRSFSHHSLDRPNFRRTDWTNFQTHLEDQIPFDPEFHNAMAIDTCVENFSGAVLQALEATTPKRRTRDDPRLLVPAGIQDEIRLKTRLRRRWQVTSDRALKAEVNRLQRSATRRLNEWRNDQWGATLESHDPEDQLLSRMTKRVIRFPTLTPNQATLIPPKTSVVPPRR
jgi:hypothetical protein